MFTGNTVLDPTVVSQRARTALELAADVDRARLFLLCVAVPP